MLSTRNTLPATIRAQSVELLNRHLAVAVDLHAQMKQARWNTRGLGTGTIRNLFGRLSVQVEDYADLMAERAGELGGTAWCTIQAAAGQSFLPPYPQGITDEKQHVFAISGALVIFGHSIRSASTRAARSGDADTAALFTEISRGVDRQLRSIGSRAVPGTGPALRPPPLYPLGAIWKPLDAVAVWVNEGGAGEDAER